MRPDPIFLTLKAGSSIAHGEAGAHSAGPNNTTLFARQLTLLQREQLGFSDEAAAAALDRLFAQYPIGRDAVEFLRSISGPELVAVLFTAQFPLVYSGTGEGLFSGMDRYTYLATRLTDAAACSTTLGAAWGFVARKLNLTVFGESAFGPLSALFALPRPIQAAALSAILRAPELVVMGARLVAESVRATSERYAEAAGLDFNERVAYTATDEQREQLTAQGGKSLAVRIPALSGNALRHCAIREPGANRLLAELGLSPQESLVSVGVERFLYGGGNTAKGAKAPGSSDLVEGQVREAYPIIDALGGAFDMFLLTRSAVSVTNWIVCRENNWITERKAGVRSDVSIFDLVEEVTRTRGGIGGKDKESGQMIFSYETLAAGTEVLVEVGFQPFTKHLTVGAVELALSDWEAAGCPFGARGAQGHGIFAVVARREPQHADEYLAYLRENRARLAAGLESGQFCTELKLCAA